VAITLSRIGDPKGDFTVVANVRDRTEEERHISQIRKTSLDANRILERERALISRELHDELGQTLTAMRMSLGWLKGRLGKAKAPIQERISYCHELAGRMIDGVRDLAKSLRPPILDHQGLTDALRSHIGEFRRNTGVACHFQVEPANLVVEDPFATTIYRIVQEALTNVARHAHATRCSVYLRAVGSDLEMKVQDNGVGAEPHVLAGAKSFGVAGMKERADVIGGTLQVENVKRGGVCVTLRLPLPPRPKRTD